MGIQYTNTQSSHGEDRERCYEKIYCFAYWTIVFDHGWLYEFAR